MNFDNHDSNRGPYEPYQSIPHQKRIENADHLPIEYSDRRITDICCCCIGVIFGLILFILACVLFNKWNLLRANFPADKNGNVCVLDEGADQQKYPFVYFSDLSDPLASRQCVKDCPQAGIATQCFEGPCNIGYYPNYPKADRLGAYCMPEDDTAEQKLSSETEVGNQQQTIRRIDYLLYGLLIAVTVGLIWMLLVCIMPKIVVWVAFILAIVLLVITAIVFLIENKTVVRHWRGWAIFLAILAFIVALLLVIYLIVHRRRIKLCGIFLGEANTFLRAACCKTFFYIPFFIALAFVFGILTVFEYLAFSSISTPHLQEDSLYLNLSRSWILTALLVIQTMWGYSFFRDAFVFCVGANAVDYYFSKEIGCCSGFKAFICKHFGSVAGGSFLSAFLYFPSLIADLCCNSQDCLCFSFPRNDVYPYIYMTGTSYCPAARQVQYLCKRSKICRGNQSTNMMYSLAARLVADLIPVLCVYWMSRDTTLSHTVNHWVLLGVFFISLYVTCFFVDIHVAAAEGLQAAFLAQYQLDQEGYKGMQICPDSLKNAIDEAETEGGHYKQKE